MHTPDNGGPAFPRLFPGRDEGMSLRDYFALNLSTSEIQDLTYKSLSREAQEQLAKRKHPIEPPPNSGGGRPADYYI